MAWPRHDKLYEQIWTEYQKGFSCSKLGKMFGISRQAIYEGLKNRKLSLRKKISLPYQFFNGKKYSYKNTGYYGLTNDNRRLIHRDVWESVNGKIPKNFDIHHKDHDKSNNKIDNLELYPKAEHARKFSSGHNQFTKKEKK